MHHEITGSQYANCVAMDSTIILHVSSSIRGGSSGLITNDIKLNEVFDHDYCNSPLYCNNIAINDIVSYIAGFVVRKVKKIIHCHTCSTLLTLGSPDGSTLMLMKQKDRGNLTKPVTDIGEICQLAEQVFRGTNLLHNRNENRILHLTTTTIRRLRVNILSELDDQIKEQERLFDHNYELVKLILSSYFNIRMHHVSAIAI